MNGPLVSAFPEGIAPEGDCLVLLGVPSEKSAKQQLAGSVDDILRNVSSILNGMTMSAIEKKTAQEFKAFYLQEFPAYMRLILALSGIIEATVKKSVVNRLVSESYCELEADIREHAQAFFGEEMKDQAFFTVWTLRKIDELANLVTSGSVPNGDKRRDRVYASNFVPHALWARFNVDCLRVSMRSKKAIYPEVLTEISDGLRAAVDAYAWIKQAVDIRFPQPDIDFEFEMDDEDRELVRESMCDMAHETA